MQQEKKKEDYLLDVIIETPKGSRNKYDYDPEANAFRLKKTMPVGAVFPYDFGFIPHTKGGDGDPLDVLVIMEEAAYPGCMVACRIIGVLKAKQTERDGHTDVNDRIIGVAEVSHLYQHVTNLQEMNKNILSEIEHFFISYNQQAGKKFEPQGWGEPAEAMNIIEKGKV